jgi:hypothetical protein
MRRLLPILVAATALVAAGAGPASAGTGKCPSGGKKVITVDRLVIYQKDVFVGCFTKTGRTTRLVSHPGYDPFGVVAHGTHATVVDAPPVTQPTGKLSLTMWNLKTGKQFTTHELSDSLNLSFLDSPYGDPVTLVAYQEHGRNVLDAITNKGYRRLSDKSVKLKTVTLDRNRVAHWKEGSKRRSAKL